MSIDWQQLQTPKRGNSADEYEDAAAGNQKMGRFAVADGASESSFAGLWAKLLVEGFVRPLTRTSVGAVWFKPMQERWAKEVDGRPLPWYAEEKRSLGAYATYCGLVLRKDEGPQHRWRAEAIGDSCLFQVRDDKLVVAFPVQRAEDFGNEPKLLGARPKPNQEKMRTRIRGTWQQGDRFYLMTDALAHWCLRRCEKQKSPWSAIDAVLAQKKAQSAFEAWCEQLRERQAVRNDDMTLLCLSL